MALAQEVATANATFITPEEIRREHPAAITDLLRNRAGVDDSSGTITMRGVQGVVVILNGFPSSLFDLNQLNQDDIESIEILHGAASARFGANAMGGAIIVKTKRSVLPPTLSLTGSSTGSVGARFGGTVDVDSWQMGLTLKDENEHGYAFTPVAPYPAQITVEKERSHTKLATLSANYQNDSDKFGVELKRIDGNAYLGRPNVWEQDGTTTATITAGTKLASNVGLETRIRHENTDNQMLMDVGTGIDTAGLAPSRYAMYSGSNNNAELALNWHGEVTGLRAGTVYQRTKDRSSIRPYDSNVENFVLESVTINRALFAHVDYQMGTRVEVGLDGRYDRYEYPEVVVINSQSVSSFNSAGLTKESFNPKLEMLWHATKAVGMKVSIGTGFVPPAPAQLYYSDQATASWVLANPDLKSQRSQTEDIGISVQNGDAWSASATLFHTLWKDKIGLVILNYGIPFTQQFANIGAVESKGVEWDSRFQIIDRWAATLSYTYNNSRIIRDQSNPEWIGNILPDSPRHKLNTALAYESRELSGRLSLRTISKTFSDDANTITDAQGYRWEKGAYSLFDVTLTRRFQDMDMTMAIDNIFDRRYTTGFFILGQPRLLRIESKWRF